MSEIFQWRPLTLDFEERKNKLLISQMLAEHFTVRELLSHLDNIINNSFNNSGGKIYITKSLLTIIAYYTCNLPNFIYIQGYSNGNIADIKYYPSDLLFPMTFRDTKFIQDVSIGAYNPALSENPHYGFGSLSPMLSSIIPLSTEMKNNKNNKTMIQFKFMKVTDYYKGILRDESYYYNCVWRYKLMIDENISAHIVKKWYMYNLFGINLFSISMEIIDYNLFSIAYMCHRSHLQLPKGISIWNEEPWADNDYVSQWCKKNLEFLKSRIRKL